jgi:hypothetical protein
VNGLSSSVGCTLWAYFICAACFTGEKQSAQIGSAVFGTDRSGFFQNRQHCAGLYGPILRRLVWYGNCTWFSGINAKGTAESRFAFPWFFIKVWKVFQASLMIYRFNIFNIGKEDQMKANVRNCIVALTVCLVLLSAGWAAADEGMTVVASPFNQNKSQRWIDFLAMSEVQVEFVAPENFDSIKTKKYITIIGGVDEEAIRKLVSEIVGADEAKAMSQKGAKKMYMKEGYGSKDQKMLIFTGSDADAAALARTENRDNWMPLLQKWFDLSDTPATLKAY